MLHLRLHQTPFLGVHETGRSSALYRRYSDDILVICRPEYAAAAEEEIARLMNSEKLVLSEGKTERTVFDLSSSTSTTTRAAQYLGFTFGRDAAAIRASSLSRQWRKMRRAVKRIRKVAESEIATGRATKAYTKRLRRRFTALQFRNFSSYARRSASAFGPHENITRQVQRFEREAERQIVDLNNTASRNSFC